MKHVTLPLWPTIILAIVYLSEALLLMSPKSVLTGWDLTLVVVIKLCASIAILKGLRVTYTER